MKSFTMLLLAVMCLPSMIAADTTVAVEDASMTSMLLSKIERLGQKMAQMEQTHAAEVAELTERLSTGKKATAHTSAFRHGIRVAATKVGDKCDKYGLLDGSGQHTPNKAMCPGKEVCCCDVAAGGLVKACSGGAKAADCQVKVKDGPPTDNDPADADGENKPDQDLSCKTPITADTAVDPSTVRMMSAIIHGSKVEKGTPRVHKPIKLPWVANADDAKMDRLAAEWKIDGTAQLSARIPAMHKEHQATPVDTDVIDAKNELNMDQIKAGEVMGVLDNNFRAKKRMENWQSDLKADEKVMADIGQVAHALETVASMGRDVEMKK